jgi:hypothetical protein
MLVPLPALDPIFRDETTFKGDELLVRPFHSLRRFDKITATFAFVVGMTMDALGLVQLMGITHIILPRVNGWCPRCRKLVMVVLTSVMDFRPEKVPDPVNDSAQLRPLAPLVPSKLSEKFPEFVLRVVLLSI